MFRCVCLAVSLSLFSAVPASGQDFNTDGTIDFADFLLFAGAFGTSDSRFDLDGSGQVDFPDFLTFAEAVAEQNTLPLSPGDQAEFETPAGTVHQMVYVPAGRFDMGTSAGAPAEGPVHPVDLDAYFIDRYEVSNFQYLAFLNAFSANADADGNQLIFLEDDSVRVTVQDGDYVLKDNAFTNHPIRWVSWFGAQAYCAWTGGRLPTEAEWENAAGGLDGRTYPWGENAPRPELSNYCGPPPEDPDKRCNIDRIGSRLAGNGPFGLADMSGNVAEWVFDWFGSDYYQVSPARNPTGPDTGIFKVFRGGSFDSPVIWASRTARNFNTAHVMLDDVGFRCAREQ